MMTDLCEARDAGLGLGAQELRQRQAAQGQAANPQEAPPRDAVTVGITRTRDG